MKDSKRMANKRVQRRSTKVNRMMTPAMKKADKPRCGLCGKNKNLTETECCGNWICDDEHKYLML